MDESVKFTKMYGNPDLDPVIPTRENLEKLKKAAELSGTLKNYVYLREDKKGRYIKYAFLPGEPEHNRCLSWHCTFQPNALQINNLDLSGWKCATVGDLYFLSEFTCDKKCAVGVPNENCLNSGNAKGWTYEEPGQCACWNLKPVYKSMSFKILFND